MAKIKDEPAKYAYIPDNYETGVNAFGFNFNLRNLIEGVFLGLVLGIITFVAIYPIPFIEISGKFGMSIALTLLGLLIGIRGINDEPISIFVNNKMKQNRRTAYYNPRAKTWKKPYIDTKKESNDNLPKEKIKRAFDNISKKFKAKSSEKIVEYQSTNYFQAETMYFAADEEGGFKKPKEYMSEKELKEYQIKEEKTNKELKKYARKLQREKEERDNG